MTCGCGCGEPILDLFRYRPPYFLRGHAPSPPCACGCGKTLPYSPTRRYLSSRFIRGHDRRSKIPPLLCACGCGKETVIYQGQQRRFLAGHQNKGRKRGPGRFERDGYVFILISPNRYIGEHRLIMEAIVGRPLKRHEHVHHLNNVRSDNRPENLQLVNWSEHGTKHGHPEGVPLSNEHKAKLAQSQRAAWAKRRAGELPMPDHS